MTVKQTSMTPRKKILLVDDDVDDRDLLIDSMTHVNPEVEIAWAENGQQALEYLQEMRLREQHLPCLIVLDLNMPLLDGKATFERLRDDQVLRQVPVVVLTSSGNPMDKEHFHSHGAGFFTKPDEFSYLQKISVHLLSVCCRHLQPGA
ncbi:MAG: response regulator [Chitinophagaceae bacterium]|nr:MAG: response regulator [Chitinophagaceae bacterium]